ncbi:C-type lectin mosGCTL-1-like [Haematobia irritans]|uniref:C-type lectin mosGCTL-1-like n=1 Tax=Haematobia irritans TaxID=7368 RepID=UPI003F4F7CC6
MKGLQPLSVLLISALLWNFSQAALIDPKIFTTENFKYFIESKKKFTWSEASEECQKKSMNLVSIDTKSKADDLQIALNEAFLNNKKPIPQLYIGANDLHEYRDFVWVSKGDIFTYTNWEENEPNNYKGLNERCVHIGFHGDAKWNDVNCSRKYGFICELPLNPDDPQAVQKE